MKQVSIIGGSGFIGSHTTKRFLDAGYTVKITVTDKSKTEKYRHIIDMGSVTVEECNVLDLESVKRFVADAEILVHTGTPFYFGAQYDQEEMIKPTLEGTKNVLKACEKAPNLKKVVFISSVVAINGYVPVSAYDPDKGEAHIFTEEDEPVSRDDHDPYCRAKYQADQVVREYVKAHPNNYFEIISLYPGFVVGAPLSSRQDSTSFNLLFALKNKMTDNPAIKMLFDNDTEFAMASVKDVAEAAFRSVETPYLHGEKFLISNEAWRVSDIYKMLNGSLPGGSTRVQYSNKKAIRKLGMAFRPANEPLSEFAELVPQV